MAVDLQYTLSKAGIDVGSQRMGKLMVQQSTENGYKNLGGGVRQKKSQGIQWRMSSGWKLEKYLGKYSQNHRKAWVGRDFKDDPVSTPLS